MKYFKLILTFSVLGAFMIACQQEEFFTDNSGQGKPGSNEQREVSAETLSLISSAYFNSKDAEIIDFLLPDGSTQESLLIEGDIIMSIEQLHKMAPDKTTTKQYQTYDLVNNPETVNVIGYTGGSGQGLTYKQRTALQRAINNYNSLDIGLEFTLTFGTSYSSYDIVVYQNPNGQAGGVAGFPENGAPYKYVQIYSGMENYSTSTNEHVLTHEIGHSVGLRHTDWFSRQSCGQSGEDTGSDGAVHIPGTPTGYDPNSIMLACFNASEDGNFGYYDEVALEYLYPTPTPAISASISGPTKGNNSGTYTWSANVYNGAGSYSYDWRYSYDGSTYTYSFGTTQSVTANLPLDRDLYLKLTVTAANGTATAYKHTMNTDAM